MQWAAVKTNLELIRTPPQRNFSAGEGDWILYAIAAICGNSPWRVFSPLTISGVIRSKQVDVDTSKYIGSGTNGATGDLFCVNFSYSPHSGKKFIGNNWSEGNLIDLHLLIWLILGNELSTVLTGWISRVRADTSTFGQQIITSFLVNMHRSGYRVRGCWKACGQSLADRQTPCCGRWSNSEVVVRQRSPSVGGM